MIGRPLDQFAGVSTFALVALMTVITSTRAQVVLALILVAIWFAWHTEKRATS